MFATPNVLLLLTKNYITNRNSRLKARAGRLACLFTQKLQRQRVYYKERGFWEFCKHIFTHSICYVKFVVYETDLSKPIEELRAKIPIAIRLLSMNEADIDKLVEFWPDGFALTLSTPQRIRELIINRLSAGDECMIAEYEGKIIHMTWAGFQNTHLFQSYELKRGIGAYEVLGYCSYCTAKYRGSHIMSAVGYEQHELYRRRGYKKYISYVRPYNYASTKLSTKFGAKPVQTLQHFTILGFNICLMSRRSV